MATRVDLRGDVQALRQGAIGRLIPSHGDKGDRLVVCRIGGAQPFDHPALCRAGRTPIRPWLQKHNLACRHRVLCGTGGYKDPICGPHRGGKTGQHQARCDKGQKVTSLHGKTFQIETEKSTRQGVSTCSSQLSTRWFRRTSSAWPMRTKTVPTTGLPRAANWRAVKSRPAVERPCARPAGDQCKKGRSPQGLRDPGIGKTKIWVTAIIPSRPRQSGSTGPKMAGWAAQVPPWFPARRHDPSWAVAVSPAATTASRSPR